MTIYPWLVTLDPGAGFEVDQALFWRGWSPKFSLSDLRRIRFIRFGVTDLTVAHRVNDFYRAQRTTQHAILRSLATGLPHLRLGRPAYLLSEVKIGGAFVGDRGVRCFDLSFETIGVTA
jgi:hypothetical protein